MLFFRTSTPPIYVLLFLTATYALQRPCVYCSILLFVLVYSLFDFSADWFEPRWHDTLSPVETASLYLNGNCTFTEAIVETVTMAGMAVNGSARAVAGGVVDGVRKRMVTGTALQGASIGNGTFWLRAFLEKRQLRIPCIDVLVRL
ncbi:hypothetical protein B0A48_14247 [Cryoendolithus antarcticus]|uniref:Uncharacterized protein n=1 Tax=Cryoendolithus antarcticus TaxID=1507870 RepID=A0A1V8SLT3_9PEZI|nr:hypothetical protein B0A48_14247 [Cryoendolithus antarcticus]